jgi:hypothetical protein
MEIQGKWVLKSGGEEFLHKEEWKKSLLEAKTS